MRIAMFVGSFPLISETFILKQITGLLDMGHEVDIYAEVRPEDDNTKHSEVLEYGLLDPNNLYGYTSGILVIGNCRYGLLLAVPGHQAPRPLFQT